MEAGAAKLQYIAERDGQVACNIVAAGGLRPLVAILNIAKPDGDADQTFTMQEVAVRAVHALCVGDASNQRPVAEEGACGPLVKMCAEADHPWSIKEAAAIALARLAKEASGGPAQEDITEKGGVPILIGMYKEPDCPDAAREAVLHALRYLGQYNPAKEQMKKLGVLKVGGLTLK